MTRSTMNRRTFLSCIGGLGQVPLIGTAMASGLYQPVSVTALKGSAKSVTIPTHEFAGDLDERIDFPADWDINVMNMAGHAALPLTPRQIADKLNQPIGTKTLREIAEGKKSVVVTFDDLTRTTPAYAVTPWVVSELKAAGIKDENILFLSSYGTHRPMTALEIQKKLGKEIATRYAWMNHNTFDNLKDVGETTFKNRVRLNQTFLAADLRICLSGIKVHQDAGYAPSDEDGRAGPDFQK
jgi:nickel-dependent lactate racemase